MDATYKLAKSIVNTNYENIPHHVVEITKREILDSLGCGLAGSGTYGIKEIVEIVGDWAGKEESTILVYGGKVPAPEAALANATMIHALDFDDTYDIVANHPGVVAVSTGLAMAEREGNIIGRQLITAIALGVDLSCRMGLATKFRKPWLHAGGGWYLVSLYGFFSAAGTAGKLLGLGEKEMLNALGIAYHQAAGNVQCIDDAALTKRIGPGFAARGGIVAALMAQRGISGAHNCVEGECGIFNLYHDGCDLDKLTGALGKRFEQENLSFKPYPCCRIGHRYIDATLDLVKQYDITPREIDRIEVTAGNKSQSAWEPLEVKHKPRNTIDAQFSLPWMLACAIVRGKVGLGEFTQESIKDPGLLAVAQLVRPVYDFSFDERLDSPMDIKIKTKRGEFSKKTGAIYGSPKKVMGMEAMVNKFRDCASYAAKPIPKKNIERAIELILNLEEVHDIGEVVQLFTSRGRKI